MPIINYEQSELKDFITFVNEMIPTNTNIILEEILDHDSIKVIYSDKSFEIAYAVYFPKEQKILLPNLKDKYDKHTSLVHEYVHAWQNEFGLDYDEEQADLIAEQIYNQYKEINNDLVSR